VVNLNLEHYLDQQLNLTVYNQAGQPVKQRALGTVDQITLQLNVNDLPSGTYLIELRTSNTRRTKTLIITND